MTEYESQMVDRTNLILEFSRQTHSKVRQLYILAVVLLCIPLLWVAFQFVMLLG